MINGLKEWFDIYTHQFDSDDPIVQEGMNLKREHTLRVCKNTIDIGRSLNLCENDLHIAEAAALLHDIGRFEQYMRYKTFSDYQSEDHAELGAAVIEDQGVLSGFDPEAAEIITKVVKYHNRASVPEKEDEYFLFHLKIVRDADKVDIWRVMTDFYLRKGNERNPAIALYLPDTPHISKKIYESLSRGHLANMEDLNTLNDLKLLQMGWVYDLNYARTFQLVRERSYLENLRSTLPRQSRRVDEIYSKVGRYLEQNVFSPA